MHVMEQDQGTFHFGKQHNSVINVDGSTAEVDYVGQGNGDNVTAAGAKLAKGHGVKIGPKFRKQKSNSAGIKIGPIVTQKENMVSVMGAGSKSVLGGSKGGTSGAMTLDPMKHTVVVIKENFNPNVAREVDPTVILEFKNLVSQSSLPNFLKEKMVKGVLEKDGHNGDGRHKSAVSMVTLDVSVHDIVNKLDNGSQSLGSDVRLNGAPNAVGSSVETEASGSGAKVMDASSN